MECVNVRRVSPKLVCSVFVMASKLEIIVIGVLRNLTLSGMDTFVSAPKVTLKLMINVWAILPVLLVLTTLIPVWWVVILILTIENVWLVLLDVWVAWIVILVYSASLSLILMLSIIVVLRSVEMGKGMFWSVMMGITRMVMDVVEIVMWRLGILVREVHLILLIIVLLSRWALSPLVRVDKLECQQA